MFKNRKRAIIVAVVAVVALAAAIGGYAFWTTTGSGSSAATAAGTTAAITITPSFAANTLYPGSTGVPVSFTATNTNAGDVMVHQVVFDHVVTSPSSCLAADFSMATVTEDHRVPPGGGALPVNGTLVLADTALNQDTCKSANITLFVTSN